MKKEIIKDDLYYLIAGAVLDGLKDIDIFCLVNHKDRENTKNQTVYSWRHGVKIDAIFQDVLNRIDKIREETGRGANVEKQEPNDGTGAGLELIDFTNKTEFIKYLNAAANRIHDDKQKNDVLKMLSDHLDFKDDNKHDENNNIQRFYLPLRCLDCVLYQEHNKDIE